MSQQSTVQEPLPLDWPTHNGSRVPFGYYTRADVYDREQERIFRGPVWNYVAIEAELPNAGDFKTSFVGDTPVIVSRAEDGSVHVFVNRCAHRGSIVRRETHGNSLEHRCVYHQWCYNTRGELIGVPYRRGTKQMRGYDADFKNEEHGLRQLRVAIYRGVVFATFDPSTAPLEEFLDGPLLQDIDRIFSRPVKVLGYMRQRIQGNWKLYLENTRDPYHAGLLHGFHATFGTYRTNQKHIGGRDRARAHNTGKTIGDDFEKADTSDTVGSDKYVEGYSLRDPRLLQGRPDFNDGVTVQITSVFPSVVMQQIVNTLATRHVRPKAADDFELYWTYFGYADDDAEATEVRLKQANLIGPAGVISMEDGEAIELVQRAIEHDPQGASFIEFGHLFEDLDKDDQGEGNIRAFWRYYANLMGLQATNGGA